MIDPKAEIDSSADVGAYVVIGPNVKIGPKVVLHHHCMVNNHTTLDEGVQVHPYASVGSVPQDLKYVGGDCFLEVGKRTVIREFVTINAGTTEWNITRIGSDCLLMSYSHLGHNAVVGNNVVIANSGTLAGHVIIDDFAIIGGLVGIHQFVKIGKYTIVGGCSKVVKDLPPFMLVDGNPAKVRTINRVGLKRKGYTTKQIDLLKEAYLILYKRGFNVSQAKQHLGTLAESSVEVREILNFIEASSRGIARGETGGDE